MNGKSRQYIRDVLIRIFINFFITLSALLQINSVQAGDLGNLITTPFVDPLHAHPAILDSGVTLPGDKRPIPCGERISSPQSLTLSAAVDMALCNNASLKGAWAAIKLQSAAVGQARGAYLPTLSVTIGRMRSRTEYSDTFEPASDGVGNTVNAELNWRLYDFGARNANLVAADNLLAAAIATHNATLQKTLAGVVQSYFDAVSGQASWKAKGEDQVLAADTLESAKRRELDGYASHGDTLQATTALARASLDTHRAYGSFQKALAILTYNVGQTHGGQVVLANNVDDAPPAGSLSDSIKLQMHNLEVWIQNARESHPAILAARAHWEAARKTVASTRAAALPTIDFVADYSRNGYPGQGLSAVGSRVSSIGINITFPIFDGFAQTYKIASAQAQADQRESELNDTEQNVLMEVVKAHADLLSALENLDASDTLLIAAQDSLSSSKRRYEKGATDITEILATESALADAKQQRILCLAEWRSARLRLIADTGVLGRDVVANDGAQL